MSRRPTLKIVAQANGNADDFIDEGNCYYDVTGYLDIESTGMESYGDDMVYIVGTISYDWGEFKFDQAEEFAKIDKFVRHIGLTPNWITLTLGYW